MAFILYKCLCINMFQHYGRPGRRKTRWRTESCRLKSHFVNCSCILPFLLISASVSCLTDLRNRRWGGCVYVLQMSFSVFFSVFSVRHKNTRQPFSGTAEWIFTKLLPNDRGGNVVSNFVPKWGLGPQLFFGAKNYTLCTWWWCLASESELVCWLWHWAATAVALKRHERVNAFNLVAKDATFIFFHNR